MTTRDYKRGGSLIKKNIRHLKILNFFEESTDEKSLNDEDLKYKQNGESDRWIDRGLREVEGEDILLRILAMCSLPI